MNSTRKRVVAVAVAGAGAALVGITGALVDAPDITVVLVACGIAVPVAGMMILVPRIDKAYNLASWAKVCVRMVSLVIALWCAIGLVQLRMPFYPFRSQVKGFIVSNLWVFLSGFLIGSGITLFLSGALSKKRKTLVETSEAACVQCGGIFGIEDMIAHGDYHVCARCKPIFLQKLAEGTKVLPPSAESKA
jgi:hypothetical protein